MTFAQKILGFFFENPWGDNKEPIKPNFGQKKTTNSSPNPTQKLDELIANLKKYGNSKNGNGGNGKNTGNNPLKPLFTFIPVIIVLWLLTGFYTIQPDEQGVILRFGKYSHTSEPGLHYRLPAPIDKLRKVQVTKVNSVEIGYRSFGKDKSGQSNESIMLTGDENIVDIKFEVQWQIKDAVNYLFKIRDDIPGMTVKNAAESSMREVIGKSKLDFILSEGRSSIEQESKKLLQEILDSYESGIDVVRLQLLEADPPPQVIDAFRDVQTAKADKERTINQAESYRNDIIPRARGEASQVIEDAKAYSEQVTADAEGKAQRFRAVYEEYRKAKDVTKKRIYLDSMQQVLDSADVTIIDQNASNTGIVPYLQIQK